MMQTLLIGQNCDSSRKIIYINSLNGKVIWIAIGYNQNLATDLHL